MKKQVALCLAVFLALGIIGCGKDTAAVPLSEEELSLYRDTLAGVTTTEEGMEATEISCFFTSFYEKPEDIHFREFLRYCPVGEKLESTDSEEYGAFLSAAEKADPAMKDLPGLPVPVRRYPKEKVSAILQKYADIIIDDLRNTDGIVYLEEYDAFYNMTSDFAPGTFSCTGGEKIGKTIRLWSDSDENKMRTQLTLVAADGTYYIQSFLQVRE